MDVKYGLVGSVQKVYNRCVRRHNHSTWISFTARPGPRARLSRYGKNFVTDILVAQIPLKKTFRKSQFWDMSVTRDANITR